VNCTYWQEITNLKLCFNYKYSKWQLKLTFGFLKLPILMLGICYRPADKSLPQDFSSYQKMAKSICLRITDQTIGKLFYFWGCGVST
jgi:hypothetical protein